MINKNQLKKINPFKVHYYHNLWLFLIAMMFHAVNIQAQAPSAPTDLTVIAVSNTAVELRWVDNSSDETGFRVERSLIADSEFESFAILSANATYLLNDALLTATTYHYRVSALGDTGESGYTSVISATTETDATQLPNGWTNSEIGTPREEGSATYSDGEFETKGQGRMGINTTSDAGHFVYQSLQGNGEIIAELRNMPKAHWDHQGVMIRETLDAESQYAMNQLYRHDKITIFNGRRSDEGIEVKIEDQPADIPIWLKLERVDDTFIASISKNGKSWEETHRETISMSENVFIGLVSHANTDDKLSTGNWRNVQISQGANLLAPPTNLNVFASPTDEALLTWEDNSTNETGFRIERALKSNPLLYKTVVEVAANTTSFQDDGLRLGNIYYYRVRALNGSISSLASNEAKVEILSIQNTILFMQRLAGDYDKTAKNNIINVTTTPDTVNNLLRHPGMIGKQITIDLEDVFSSSNGSISFKIMPNTHQQTVEFFTSDALSISQNEDQLSITVNGVKNTFDVLLDSITCNHVVIRLKDDIMSPYVNGEWFADIDVGAFNINTFILGEYNGELWDIVMTNSQIADDAIYDLSEKCTNAVAPSSVPHNGLPFRHCSVYSCLWLSDESQLTTEKQRAYLYAQNIAYDKNTFDVGMYIQPDLDEWVNKDMDIPSYGFAYFSLGSLFTKNQSNTSYWLHENFHSYQVPLLKGGKWLAEASADWAAWNFYNEPLRGYAIGSFTLNPHMGIFETFPENSGYHAVVRYYHSSILLAYITTFLSDQSIIGELYNTPKVERNAFLTLIELLEGDGIDFDEEFANFAVQTTVWDYPDPKISDDFKAWERRAINSGFGDHRLVDTFSEEGTYGIYHRVPKEFLPGAYAWNSFKVESTAASTYTIKLKGSDKNPTGVTFIGKIAKGTPGNYEYFDIPVNTQIAQGDGEAQIEVVAEAGEQIFLTVAAISRNHFTSSNVDFEYEYAIESSAHVLADDHILRFVLEDETRFAIIDHENHTINAEIIRGSDITKQSPVVTLTDGASSVPSSGEELDFTDVITYQVTSSGSTSAKDWGVTVTAVPLRTGTDFISFELQDLVPFSSIDNVDHTVSANLVSEMDLTAVTPVFTLSDGATSQPASGEVIDLTSSVTYTVTAEDGITIQNWTISAADFRPFITTWKTETVNEVISIGTNGDYNFSYVWKDATGSEIKSGSFSSDDGEAFDTNLPVAGSYTLEIKGSFPRIEASQQLIDVNQWGNISWRSMFRSFNDWEGVSFSAVDLPDLSKVSSLSYMFYHARSFNGDLSQWDVSNVTSMVHTFSGAREFNGDISNWDVSNVTDMTEMFREARAFNSDIGLWNVSKVTIMDRMFFSSTAFNRNLGNWDITNVQTMYQMLGAVLSRLNYDRTLIGWAAQKVKEDIVFGASNNMYCDGEEARASLINDKNWIITDGGLNCPEGGEANILVFEIDQQTSAATFDYDSHAILIEVLPGTDVTTLAPRLTLSKDATSTPISGAAVDFTDPVAYTVTALDGTTKQDWIVSVDVEEVLGLRIESIDNYIIYPNPVVNKLKLESPQLVTAYLTELSGRQVTPKQTGKNLTLDMTKMNSGIYLLIIKDGNTVTTRKIIKQTE